MKFSFRLCVDEAYELVLPLRLMQ